MDGHGVALGLIIHLSINPFIQFLFASSAGWIRVASTFPYSVCPTCRSM